MAIIRITNLRLRTIIGANDWERHIKQDLIINVTLDFDATKAAKSDNLKDTVDYKALTKKIIKTVEASSYQLLESLGTVLLNIILEDRKVKEATVRIDKPGALRFAKSVSVTLTSKDNE